MNTPLDFISRTAFGAILLTAIAVLASAGSASAASATFTNTSGGDWQTNSNWNPAAKPSAATDLASFADGTYTVTSTGNMTGKPNVLTGQNVEFDFGSFTLSANGGASAGATVHGGSLTLSSGSFVGTNSFQSIGFNSSSSSLLVTGTNSTWSIDTAGSRLGRANTAGGSANSNTVTVAAGARFNDTSTGTFVIGHGTALNATADNNSFTVTGAGSIATAQGGPTIGLMTTTATLVGNNRLVVDNGGNMTVAGNIRIGERTAGTSTALSNNLVVVGGNGTGSVLTVNGSGGISIAVSGVGTGSGVQVKSGGTINATNGNTTLSAGATNTYLSVDGGTFNAGTRTIALNGSGTSLSLANNGTVTAGSVSMQAGGLLTGSGKVVAATSVSGTFAPGVNTIGTMVLDGSNTANPILRMNLGATFNYELGAGLTSDKVNLWNYTGEGDFVRNSNVINITFLGGATAGTYNLFNFYSDDGTTATAAGFSSGLTLNFTDGGSGTLDYSTPGQINLVATAVPEPTTLALLAGSLATLMLLRSRRRRS